MKAMCGCRLATMMQHMHSVTQTHSSHFQNTRERISHFQETCDRISHFQDTCDRISYFQDKRDRISHFQDTRSTHSRTLLGRRLLQSLRNVVRK